MVRPKARWQREFEDQVGVMSNDTLLTNLTNISESIGGERHFGTQEYRRDGIRQQIMKGEVMRRMMLNTGQYIRDVIPGYIQAQDERSKFRGL